MSSSSITIRRANSVDAGQIVAVINAVCAEGEFFSTPHYIPDAQWETVLHHPETAPIHLLYVAECDGVIIGEAQILPGEDQHDEGEIGIGIQKDYRDRGIGSKLLAQLLKDANLHYNKIILYVLATNERAIHLFEKYGFEKREVRLRVYAHLGEREQLRMRLEL